jgi:lysophospholipase L1-like esterase
MFRCGVFIAIVLTIVAIVVGCGESGGSEESARARVMLSLGDSVAAGSGSSDASQTSYASLVAQAQGLELVNLAVPNATTDTVLGDQLPEIEAAVGDRDVELIVISAGGNDLAALIPNAACVEDPLPASCPLDDTLYNLALGLGFVLDDLEVQFPEARIVLLAYPNFFSGTGHPFDAPASRVLPRLAQVVRGVDASYEAREISVAEPSFEGRGGELTHVLDEQFDPHPNDGGHRVIADSVLEALGEGGTP